MRKMACWMMVGAVLGLGACREQDEAAPQAEVEPEPLRTLRALARPLSDANDLDPLLERIGAARLILLGEASHGTAEFYEWRDVLTRRLVAEKEFDFVVVEGDWTACYELNRYVKDLPGAGGSAREIMRAFTRWPTWMWANEEVEALIEWMRARNLQRPMEQRTGFYGMDVYGEDAARENVIENLEALDSDLAEKARTAYRPFLEYGGDSARYAQAVARGAESLADNARAVTRLVEKHADRLRAADAHRFLDLEQSARVVENAERHYRAMTTPGPGSWNTRAQHFYRTAERLLAYHGPDSRGVVWAHNTHVGDARATDMVRAGRHNIGQMARETLGRENTVSVGFGTYQGTVKAGRQWGGDRQLLPVPAAKPDSMEDWMHRLEMERALLLFDPDKDLSALHAPCGHRAIGVVYNPEVERRGNYVSTRLAARYDAFIFLSETRAVTPIHP